MPTREFTEFELYRKDRAERIMVRFYFEKKQLADCWDEVCPGSTASRDSKKKMAWDDIQWHKETFPSNIEAILFSNHLDEHNVMAEFSRILFHSNLAYKDADGVLHDSGLPDAKTRLAAIRQWGAFRGYGKAKQPIVPSLHPEHRVAESERDLQVTRAADGDIPAGQTPDDQAEAKLPEQLSDEQWDQLRDRTEAASQPPQHLIEEMEREMNTQPGFDE